jgi:hypothetical protein
VARKVPKVPKVLPVVAVVNPLSPVVAALPREASLRNKEAYHGVWFLQKAPAYA